MFSADTFTFDYYENKIKLYNSSIKFHMFICSFAIRLDILNVSNLSSVLQISINPITELS